MLPFDGTTLGYMNEFTGSGRTAMQAQLNRVGVSWRWHDDASSCALVRQGRSLTACACYLQYLLLRDAVPRALVLAGCASITAEVHKNGWLVENTDPADLIVKAEPPGGGMLREVESDVLMNDAAVRRVLHGDELHGIFRELFGEPAVSLDYKWFRAVVPQQYSGFHMVRGSASFHSKQAAATLPPQLCRSI